MTDEEINSLIEKRNLCRRDRQYAEADEIKQSLRVRVPGIKILDTPFKQGGGSSWYIEVVLPSNVSLVELSKEVFNTNDPESEAVASMIATAKHYCGLCEQHRGHYEGNMRPSDAQGRQWADAAFHFAMGGIKDKDLYCGLVKGALAELNRVGNRKSFRTIDIIQMAEKFAGAGVTDQLLYQSMSELIKRKTPKGTALPDSLRDLESGQYTLLSNRPLYALFRFAARQSKHGRQRLYDVFDDGSDEEGDDVQSVPEVDDEDIGANITAQADLIGVDFDINTLFDDASLPLVLDLGCGYGVSLLGLSHTFTSEGDLPRYNFFGCDMNARAMNFANSISDRWGMGKNCVFVVCDIIKGLGLSLKYTGPIHWVSINFPTPYRQDMIPDMMQRYSLSSNVEHEDTKVDTESPPTNTSQMPCNSQLPSLLSDFMVTSEVYRKIGTLFETSLASHGHLKSYLYLQSNVQDVAVVMNGMLCEAFQQYSQTALSPLVISSEVDTVFDCDLAVPEPSLSKKRKLEDNHQESITAPSKRQLLWSEKGGKTTLRGYMVSSPSGSTTLQENSEFWLHESPLPFLAKTETEVMCTYNNKPVFRQLFSFAKQKSSSS